MPVSSQNHVRGPMSRHLLKGYGGESLAAERDSGESKKPLVRAGRRRPINKNFRQ